LYTGYRWTSKTDGIQFGIDGISGGLSFYDGSNPYSASIFRDTDEFFYVGVRSGQTLNGIVLNKDGFVGCGIKPTERLHVAGNGLFTGNVTAGGDITVGSTGRLILRQSNTYLTGGGHCTLRANGIDYWRAEGTSNIFRIYQNTIVEGNITAQGEVTAYSSSDRRLKSDIKPITNATSIVMKLKPVQFKWNQKALELNSSKSSSISNFGFI